jgi:hypothetical protein
VPKFLSASRTVAVDHATAHVGRDLARHGNVRFGAFVDAVGLAGFIAAQRVERPLVRRASARINGMPTTTNVAGNNHFGTLYGPPLATRIRYRLIRYVFDLTKVFMLPHPTDREQAGRKASRA